MISFSDEMLRRAYREGESWRITKSSGAVTIVPSDPTRHPMDITWGWDELRKETKVSCRLHDLRHTSATHLAENGVSESTILAMMGHIEPGHAGTLQPHSDCRKA